MDNLTHSLIGAAIANAGLKQRYGRGTTLALVLASNITDIDALWGVVHPGPSFLYRRMLTHAVVGMPVLAAICAWVHHRFFPNLTFKTCYWMYLLGMAVHVLFDTFNSFGVVYFYPFTRARYELAWVFIIDLAIWFFLLAPLLLALIRSRWTDLQSLSRVALACLIVYLGFCSALRARSERALGDYVIAAGMEPSFSYVFPEALGPHRFKGVVREKNLYRVYQVDAIGGRVTEAMTARTYDFDAAVDRIKSTDMGEKMMWFAKAPVWIPTSGADEGGQRWAVYDLRFTSTVIGRSNPFTFGFESNPNAVVYLGAIDVPEDQR